MIALFAEAPALPLHTAGPYVAAAYIVFLLVVLIYVGIMARKLIANSRELRELRAQLDARASVEGLAADVEAAGMRTYPGPQNDNESHSRFDVVENESTGGGADVA